MLIVLIVLLFLLGVGSLGIAAVLGGQLVTRAWVEGFSMLPTLGPGDQIVALRYPRSWLRRGQIVLLREFRSRTGYGIKRIAALPGDALHGELETWAAVRSDSTQDESGTLLLVEPGQVIVRGDNRDGSIDSCVVGAIPLEHVLGVVVWRIYRSSELSSA